MSLKLNNIKIGTIILALGSVNRLNSILGFLVAGPIIWQHIYQKLHKKKESGKGTSLVKLVSSLDPPMVSSLVPGDHEPPVKHFVEAFVPSWTAVTNLNLKLSTVKIFRHFRLKIFRLFCRFLLSSVTDPGCYRGGVPTSEIGVPNTYFAKEIAENCI